MGGSHERSGSDALIERVPGNGTYPTSPVVELLDWLSHLAAHAGLGLAIGVIAARLMRRAHLHWSWAAGCVACEALAAQSMVTGLTSTFGVATVSAALWGRRWHRHDIALGVVPPDFALAKTLLQMNQLRAPAPEKSTLVESVVRRTREKHIGGDWSSPGTRRWGAMETSRRP